jgi:hypothetical protein
MLGTGQSTIIEPACENPETQVVPELKPFLKAHPPYKVMALGGL